ncbi:quinone oxidoreductase family protein [Microvirgula aerodenitrificans]|uniref:quinone oxidoreductase family protein n=1 Tax=Microvirgula aerodenitrificans TaxID=57480 RepID=UPI000492188A|nr:zinc-binding alcohol dehydrogenase family protein [Microvirgula aerodenitrificans]
MHAAVVYSFDTAPVFGRYEEPCETEGHTVVRVLAAPISPIVKSLAAGKHYTAAKALAVQGFVPGIDGVGLNSKGERVYFMFPTPPFGSMAEKSLVATAATVPVPEGVEDGRAAAVVTAGLSSWVALTRRAKFLHGETVLINGATGSAGSLAVQIALHLGADRIIVTGRNLAKLASFPPVVEKIALDEHADTALREAFSRGVDVVLDYLWGEPASRVIAAATHGRGSRSGEPRLRYVQLGSIAGESIPLAAHAFRSSGLEIIGSGIGSLSMSELIAGAGELLAVLPAAGFDTPVKNVLLRDVTDAWNDVSEAYRIVLRP